MHKLLYSVPTVEYVTVVSFSVSSIVMLWVAEWWHHQAVNIIGITQSSVCIVIDLSDLFHDIDDKTPNGTVFAMLVCTLFCGLMVVTNVKCCLSLLKWWSNHVCKQHLFMVGKKPIGFWALHLSGQNGFYILCNGYKNIYVLNFCLLAAARKI